MQILPHWREITALPPKLVSGKVWAGSLGGIDNTIIFKTLSKGLCLSLKNNRHSEKGIRRMKARVVARKPIIAAATGLRFADKELEILDGIRCGPVHEVRVITEKVRNDLIEEFRKLNPGFSNADYEIVTELDSPGLNGRV